MSILLYVELDKGKLCPWFPYFEFLWNKKYLPIFITSLYKIGKVYKPKEKSDCIGEQ